MVWRAFRQCAINRIGDCIRLLQDIMIPEAKRLETALLEKLVPLFVSDGLGVLTAVDFYHQLSFKTHKIKDAVKIRMLPPELAAVQLPATQYAPQALFCIRHAGTQATLQAWRQDRLVRLSLHLRLPLSHTIPSQTRPALEHSSRAFGRMQANGLQTSALTPLKGRASTHCIMPASWSTREAACPGTRRCLPGLRQTPAGARSGRRWRRRWRRGRFARRPRAPAFWPAPWRSGRP